MHVQVKVAPEHRLDRAGRPSNDHEHQRSPTATKRRRDGEGPIIEPDDRDELQWTNRA